MLIHSVKLENIRSYTNEKIDFPEGSTLLSGDIGSGKSTILLAIEFALFGLNKGAGNSLLRHGKKEGSVELNFSVDEKNITIKRVLKRSNDEARQSSGFIITDGLKSELTPIEIKSRVIELLGYPKESLAKKDMIYTYTVYTPQEEMKQILTDSSEARVEILRKIFGIDKYKRIRDNCAILEKELKENKARLEGKSADLELKTKEKKSLDDELKMLAEMIKETIQKLEAAKKKADEAKTRLKESEARFNMLAGITKDLEHTENSIKEKEKMVSELKNEQRILSIQIDVIKKKISEIQITPMPLKSEEDIEKDINEKQEIINDILKKRELVKEKINNVNSKAEEINRRIEELEKSNDELKKKKLISEKIKQEIELTKNIEEEIEKNSLAIQEIANKINESKIHINNSTNVIDNMNKLDSCPTCFQEVSDEHKRSMIEKETRKTKELTVDLMTFENQKKNKEDTLKKQKQEHSEMLSKKNMLERLNAELKMLEDNEKRAEQERKIIEILREDKTLLKMEFEELCREDTERIKKTIENLKKMKEIIKNNKMREKEKEHMAALAADKLKQIERLILQEKNAVMIIGEKKKTSKELMENIKELGAVEELYKKLSGEFEIKAIEERKAEIEKIKAENDILNCQKRSDSLENEINEKQGAKKKVSEIAEMQNWIDNYFVELMAIMERQIMANIYWQFNELFKQWFEQLMEDDTISARIDENFTPIVEQNGYDTKIEFLSGGEKTSAALAYRLALNKVINKLVSHIRTKDIIILDEPTDGFSSEQLDKVRNVLDELEMKQLILVSHENKIESFVNNVIRINKNEHESRVVS